ncbi:uncharacterized protein LOC119112901 isoform X2 [Pollicipes pollicipes]|nr:uncharacterized protein LOC119112901 isoform X2 [Pollicipes pollicipes]
MHTQEQLVEQISEVQAAVLEMKASFTGALEQLTASSQPAQEASAAAEAASAAPHVQLLISQLQVELGTATSMLQQLQEGQEQTRQQLQQLLYERDILLDELCKTGSVSDQIRQRLHQPQLHFPSRTPSGCHSTDSGVGHVLHKARSYGPSDPESGSLPDRPLVSTMVQEYVNGLGREANGYESDSSLTMAVSKSFTLSTSLSKQCDLELDELSESDSEGQVKSASAPVPDESERLKVVRELVETERRYCGTLWTLQDTFAEPLAASSVLTSSELSTLFPDEIGGLYEKHCRLLHTLEERLEAWHWRPHVGHILYKFINRGELDVLRMYTSYVNDFPEVLKIFYKLCRTSSEFTKFLKSRLQHPSCNGLDLGAFLLSPVQRVPRYVLLLKQLLRHTPPAHGDHDSLQAVLDALKQFLARLNDSMEHSFQLVAVHMSSRELDGRLSKQSHKSATYESAKTGRQSRVGPGERAALRRRSKSKPAYRSAAADSAAGRLLLGIDRTGSSSSSQTQSSEEASGWGGYGGRTAAQKARRHRQYDCQSLPHIKHRRRSQLTAARSETCLRDACCHLPAPPPHERGRKMHAKSVHNLHVETSSEVLHRLEYEEVALSEPSLCDAPISERSQSSEKRRGSRTLPRGRSASVVGAEQSTAPKSRDHSVDKAAKAEKRRVSLRAIKNMFSLKKRSSRSGVLNISDSSCGVAAPSADQYTPLQDGSTPASQGDFTDEEGRACSNV